MSTITTATQFTYKDRVSTGATTTITFGVTGLGENLSDAALGEIALADVALYMTKKYELDGEPADAVYSTYMGEEFVVKVYSLPVK